MGDLDWNLPEVRGGDRAKLRALYYYGARHVRNVQRGREASSADPCSYAEACG